MKFRLFVIILMIVPGCLGKCSADEVPTPTPDSISTPLIILPMRNVNVVPDKDTTPIAKPEIIDTIKPGVYYVIRSKVALFVMDFPRGSVSIIGGVKDADGIFADGDGTPETREFDPSEHIYLIQGLRPCKTEICMVPEGVAKKADIIRQVLIVSGEGPKPPPDPDPKPDPKPDPEPTPTAKHLRLSIIFDHQNVAPEVAILMNALVGWNSFFDAGSEYRKYDITTPEPEGIKAIEQLNGPTPGIVVTNKDTGEVIHKGPLPATFSDLKVLVGRLTNG